MSIIVDLLNTILFSLNFFKSQVRLKINNQEFYSSRIGELISLFIVFILLYTLITSDVFLRNSPETLEKSLVNKIHPLYKLNAENFIFSVRLSGDYGVGYYEDPTIFEIYAEYSTIKIEVKDNQKISLNSTLNFTKMIPCKDSVYSKIKKYDLITKFPESLCLPQSDFDIEGSFEETYVSIVKVSVIPCQNKTNNNNLVCKSEEEIHNFFKEKYFSYAFLDKQVDMENFENPINEKLTIEYKLIESTIRKRIYIRMNQAQFKSDSNLYSNDYDVQSFWNFGNPAEDFDYSNQTSVFEAMIQSGNAEKIFIRRYQKLQNAFADLGGISNFFFLMGTLFLKMIPFNGIYFLLANHLFSFKKWNSSIKKKMGSKDEDKKRISSSHQNKEFLELSVFEKRELLFQTAGKDQVPPCQGDVDLDLSSKDSLKIITEFQRKKKIDKNLNEALRNYLNRKKYNNQLRFSFFDFLGKENLIVLFKKLKILLYAQEKVEEELDIMKILEKIQEIDKLKSILLGPVQVLLFNFLKKPEILTSDMSNNKVEISQSIETSKEIVDDKVKYNEDFMSLFFYFNKGNDKNEKIYQEESRLNKLLDPDIKKFFDEKS